LLKKRSKKQTSTEKYKLGNKQQQDASMNYCPLYSFVMAIMLGLTYYCADDKIEKNEMGWACGAYG